MTPCTIIKALHRAICLGCLKFLFIKVAVTWSRLYRRSCITGTTETLREPWRKKENSQNVEPARSHKRATRSGNRRWYGVGSDNRTASQLTLFFFLLSCHWDYFFGLCTVPIASPSLRRGLYAQARMRLAPWYPSFFQQNSWKQVTNSLVSKYKMCVLSENRVKDPLRGIP